MFLSMAVSVRRISKCKVVKQRNPCPRDAAIRRNSHAYAEMDDIDVTVYHGLTIRTRHTAYKHATQQPLITRVSTGPQFAAASNCKHATPMASRGRCLPKHTQVRVRSKVIGVGAWPLRRAPFDRKDGSTYVEDYKTASVLSSSPGGSQQQCITTTSRYHARAQGELKRFLRLSGTMHSFPVERLSYHENIHERHVATIVTLEYSMPTRIAPGLPTFTVSLIDVASTKATPVASIVQYCSVRRLVCIFRKAQMVFSDVKPQRWKYGQLRYR
ncbi:hypothetical protein PR048_005688 [Dryococelus australis]|uniref:Uncharacterized protein n=1 Tax=Dryococelus australis TaxID=614101 RepID=A0ABQ9I8X5_9NEOP|nr:hypothetical protein PR048_005688 [Dryococelus australis]